VKQHAAGEEHQQAQRPRGERQLVRIQEHTAHIQEDSTHLAQEENLDNWLAETLGLLQQPEQGVLHVVQPCRRGCDVQHRAVRR